MTLKFLSVCLHIHPPPPSTVIIFSTELVTNGHKGLKASMSEAFLLSGRGGGRIRMCCMASTASRPASPSPTPGPSQPDQTCGALLAIRT